jgi:2-dehydro-3-deoxy-D-arabinonate dehydratase
MKIYKIPPHIGVEFENRLYLLGGKDWDFLINCDNLFDVLKGRIDRLEKSYPLDYLKTHKIAAPIGNQEIWASGVTYLRSRDARMEESKQGGGDTFYDKVYVADRPELFFKATASRTVGTNAAVRIRKDSTWDVPEPELTLFINKNGKIQGYTIGNDMSSRSIEGENPLYLPQAKTYDGCAALGPCIYIPQTTLSPDTEISIKIYRKEELIFNGEIFIDRMKRTHDELVAYLFRECSFPNGCFLMTGTGIVPPNDFTLKSKDKIDITIDSIGTLSNWVE